MTLLMNIDELGVAHVRLNRPERHNAFDISLITALHKAILSLEKNKLVRVILLSGQGPSFCAGGDLTWMKSAASQTKSQNEKDAQKLANLLYALKTVSKPTLALAHGSVMGGGTGLVAACDIAMASEKAVFSFSEVRLGLIPATIGPYVLSAIGARHASRYFLTGEKFTASTALEIGLVHQVVPVSTELESYAYSFLQNTLLQCGSKAVAEAKKLIWDLDGRAISPGLGRLTAKKIAKIRATPEAREGMTAFLEKRSPQWRSKNARR